MIFRAVHSFGQWIHMIQYSDPNASPTSGDFPVLRFMTAVNRPLPSIYTVHACFTRTIVMCVIKHIPMVATLYNGIFESLPLSTQESDPYRSFGVLSTFRSVRCACASGFGKRSCVLLSAYTVCSVNFYSTHNYYCYYTIT